jgi:hypothetical protein
LAAANWETDVREPFERFGFGGARRHEVQLDCVRVNEPVLLVEKNRQGLARYVRHGRWLRRERGSVGSSLIPFLLAGVRPSLARSEQYAAVWCKPTPAHSGWVCGQFNVMCPVEPTMQRSKPIVQHQSYPFGGSCSVSSSVLCEEVQRVAHCIHLLSTRRF